MDGTEVAIPAAERLIEQGLMGAMLVVVIVGLVWLFISYVKRDSKCKQCMKAMSDDHIKDLKEIIEKSNTTQEKNVEVLKTVVTNMDKLSMYVQMLEDNHNNKQSVFDKFFGKR